MRETLNAAIDVYLLHANAEQRSEIFATIDSLSLLVSSVATPEAQAEAHLSTTFTSGDVWTGFGTPSWVTHDSSVHSGSYLGGFSAPTDIWVATDSNGYGRSIGGRCKRSFDAIHQLYGPSTAALGWWGGCAARTPRTRSGHGHNGSLPTTTTRCYSLHVQLCSWATWPRLCPGSRGWASGLLRRPACFGVGCGRCGS